MLDEFFRLAFHTKLYETVEALQTELDAWLHDYNYERPHQGYRNLGKRPFECLETQLVQQQIVPPVLDPPTATDDQPGAQPHLKAVSAVALSGGEHRAKLEPFAGGNGGSREVVKVQRSREKISPIVRDDG